MNHSFLRAIGFSGLTNNTDLYKVIDDVIYHSDIHAVERDANGNDVAYFTRFFGQDLGITVCGCFLEKDRFRMEYFYPFFRGLHISTREPVDIEQQAAQTAFFGICDELKMGIPLIFYINNPQDVLREARCGHGDVRPQSVLLTGLGHHGKILLPLMKTKELVAQKKRSTDQRRNLLLQAREGNRAAMENLTLSDMDLYAAVSRRVMKEDVLSIVESSIIPYGVESDQYTVIGEILACRSIGNPLSGESLWVLTLSCNGLQMDVCLHEEDLLGEPAVGRRFKGRVWMQGQLQFDYDGYA